MQRLILKRVLSIFFIFSVVTAEAFAGGAIVRKNTTVACLAQLKTLIQLSNSMVNVSEFTREELRKFRRKILQVSSDPFRSYRDMNQSSESADRESIQKMAGRLFALEQSLLTQDPDEKTYAIYLDGDDIKNINKYIENHHKNIGRLSLHNSETGMGLMAFLSLLGIISGAQLVSGDLSLTAPAFICSGAVCSLAKLFQDLFKNAALIPSESFQFPELTEGWHYSGFSEKIESHLVKPVLENNMPSSDAWNAKRFLDLIPPGLSQLFKQILFPGIYQNKLILGDILYWRENPQEPTKLIISFRVRDRRPNDEKATKPGVLESWNAIKNLKPAKIRIKPD